MEQGFDSVLALGELNAAPALLQRQSVVAGVSNGEVLVRVPATKTAQLRSTRPQLANTILESFGVVPLRNSMAPGERSLDIFFHD